jgi:hypothetical protein
MARRVFVHIGTMKSATTYVQELCQANAQQLADQGVLWPPADLPFLAVAELQGRDEQRPGRTGSWDRLMSAFAAHPGTTVFSNELLAPVGRKVIRQIVMGCKPAKLHVVLTARDLARVIPSHWQTTLKNGGTTPWAEFAAAVCAEPTLDANIARSRDTGSWFWRRHDIPAIISRWAHFVSPEHITVVTVPPAGGDTSVVGTRFARAIGVSADGFAEPDHDNSSVGAYSAELLRRLNSADPGFERHHFRWGVKDALVRHGLAGRAASEPGFGLSVDQHDWVCRRADRMITDIEAAGVTVVGDLSDLRPAARPVTDVVDPASATDSDLLPPALVGLAGLARVVADLRLEEERAAAQRAAEPGATPYASGPAGS